MNYSSYMRRTLLPCLALILGMLMDRCALGATPTFEQMQVMRQAAREQGINVQYLVKIGYVESRFNQEARRVNENGTLDVGMFQINSIHWDSTCKKYDVLTLEGNARCAALLIKKAKRWKVRGDSKWLARYHSNTPKHKDNYYAKLERVPL